MEGMHSSLMKSLRHMLLSRMTVCVSTIRPSAFYTFFILFEDCGVVVVHFVKKNLNQTGVDMTYFQ